MHNVWPYLAVTLFNIINGTGTVIGSYGQSSMSPALFAMIRTAIASPILMLIAGVRRKKCIPISLPQDWKAVVLPGFFLYINILFWMIGTKLASSVQGSNWQILCGPLSLMYGYFMGVEHNINIYKIFGILVSISGALFMVLYNNSSITQNSSFWAQFGGSVCFFINVTAASLYFISLKLYGVKKHDTITLTAYSYLFAFIFIAITTVLFSLSDSIMSLICQDCTAWSVPSDNNIFAMAYYIFAVSIVSYLLIIWATKYLSPATSLIFTVLQPVSTCAMNQILLALDIYPQCEGDMTPNYGYLCVYALSISDLGVIGIIIGLFLVIYGNEKANTKRHKLLDSNNSNIRSYNSTASENAQI